MKKIQILLLTILIPFLGYTQINTFPWIQDFENGVGLINDTTDDGDWQLRSGNTPSFQTGPSGDHTTGAGSYWYVEASFPNYPYLYFISQTDSFDISSTPGQVLSFWYHMYGNNMGDLNIWIADDNGLTKIDSIQGDQGDQWHLKYIDLDNLGIVGDFAIFFEGITGSYWDSDIAIDDLYIGDSYSVGCMDPNALNFDPSAIIDDGSCAYPPCGGILNSSAYQMCWGSQAAIQFEWETDTLNFQCDVIEIHVGNENGWGQDFPGYWPASNGWQGFAVAVGNGQMPPNWSVEFHAVLEFADGTLSDTIFYTPSSCIPGCMDPTQIAYNPFATIDDGSCTGTTCDPATEHQITINITLDNWPGETSWELATNTGTNIVTPTGTYNYNDIGVTYTYTHCVSSTAGFEFIINDTYGDGIQGNGQPGSAGDVVIFDCNGDTITYLSSGNWVDINGSPTGVSFGNVAYSGPQNGVACAGPPAIPGCLDPNYQEFNPLANVDDSSCVNLHVFGCTDPAAFNYDPSASQMDLIPVCNYTLTIEDGAADGWGNSYLGVVQGTNLWTYTMGPGYSSQTFNIPLDSDMPVTVYYFEVPNAQNPDPLQTTFQTMQNSFVLENENGVMLLDEGSNPFANNGQGALQGFGPPFWTTYSAMPYCGDYCIDAVFGCTDSTAFNYVDSANTDDGSCISVVLGCTNSLAFNYDSLANTDDGSCVAEVIGCMDSTAFNFNPSANTNDPASCIPVILGCMDDTQFNYNAAANTDDGSCIPYIFGCTDPLAFNYDPLANTNNFSCIPVLLGCTDPTAFNFNVNANTDDGTCVPIVIGCTDATALNYDSTANVNFGCTYPILGCTDPTAFNYNSLANVDDGSCLPIIYGCTDSTAWNYDPLANTNIGCIPFYYGCTDPTQFNYDPLANTDDGSCVPFILGCNDPTALNYDSTANVNTGCVYPVYGCTDPTAFNYDVNANVDDSSCVPYIYGCTDSTATNFNSLANTNVGCIYPIFGCTDPNAFNFNINANTDDGSCVPVIIGCTDATALNFDSLANTNNGCIYPIYGCTDPLAFNFNLYANSDDGSCIPVVIGCTDATALNYDSTANVNNGCVYPILGCTNPTQFNYDPLANTDDGSCVPYIYGCTDNTMFNYAPAANTENGSCIPFVYGCTDSTAFNYDPLANTDNNTCIIYVYGCTNPIAINYNPLANTDDGSCINPIYGCTDSTQFNYNPLANTDNGTCIPFIYGCTNPNALNYTQSANTDDGSCITPIYGCMDSTQFNYNPLANVDNGSCEPFVYGCNDATAFNYDPLANTSDNSCCYISGCTDPTALNYNIAACYDDGSCVTIITGCTDVAAYNFDPTANVSDSTACLYDAGCYGGPGIPYWLNDGCYAWVIDVDEYCCTNDWDANCIQLYDYCQQGMPTNINELLRENNIMIYPNPTRNIVNLEYKKDARVDLYGPLGELIISGDNIKQIDLSEYSNGIYVLYMTYNNKTITHKIIKQ